VTSAAGTSNVVQYTYDAPSIITISPDHGAPAGGTQITLTGTNLTGANAVDFGSSAATNVQVVDDQHLTATAPPMARSGTVPVTVTSPSGTSNAAQFTYDTPAISSIAPNHGAAAGGTPVTITGTNLTGATGVSFGNTPATSYTYNSDSSVTATAPGGAGTVDVTVTTPAGQSATGPNDRFSYDDPVAPATPATPAPTVTGVSPASGPAGGGTEVTITGTNLANASAVHFGGNSAPITSDNYSQIKATVPAGTGTVDVTVTTPGGTSATSQSDKFAYSPPPAVTPSAPAVKGTTAAGFNGSVNPEGLPTTAYFQYGLDSRYLTASDGLQYSDSTQPQQVGSDSSDHPVSATVSNLVPNATYHVRLVATNGAGTTYGPDQTFTTLKDVPPPPPVLGQTVNVKPVSGRVFIKPPPGKHLGKATDRATTALAKGQGFIPLTEARQIPSGSQIDARQGTLQLTTATTQRGKSENGQFGGAIFNLTQAKAGLSKGLTTLTLQENAFRGAPSYGSCPRAATDTGAHAARLSSRVLQTLHASERGGHYRTRGRYSASTVRGTVWDTVDRCDGTLTIVRRGVVQVNDLIRHVTVTVTAGHSYLAKARKGG
jgi:hypothetical protein